MIYFMVVGAPPYPEFMGCSMIPLNRNMILVLWTLVIIWEACKYKCVVQCPSSDWKYSIVDAHVGACHPSMWAILVLKIGSAHIIFSILDRGGGSTSLVKVVYRDGKSLLFLSMATRLNLDIGVVYYLYLLGRSCAENESVNHSWCRPVLSCINLIVFKTLPVSWGVPFDFFLSF